MVWRIRKEDWDMKFSIIVPVYNAEKYLDRLVDSVLKQTYSDYELILVDDGSTDQSYALMQKYQAENIKIKAYTKMNTGPGMTRKYGYEKSTGELLFFVDSDDWISTSETLEEIAGIFRDNPKIDVLFFDREDIVGKKKDIIRGFEQTPVGIHSIEEINEVIRPGLGAKILKKSILKSDMFIESNIFEDLYTTYEYLERCNCFYYVAKCFYSIYHDAESSSLSSNETAISFSKSLEMILKIYNRTKKTSLRYSLELRMATLFTHYWKARIRRNEGFDSHRIKRDIDTIVKILRENRVVIKPTSKKKIKVLIYRAMLFISGGKNEQEKN